MKIPLTKKMILRTKLVLIILQENQVQKLQESQAPSLKLNLEHLVLRVEPTQVAQELLQDNQQIKKMNQKKNSPRADSDSGTKEASDREEDKESDKIESDKEEADNDSNDVSTIALGSTVAASVIAAGGTVIATSKKKGRKMPPHLKNVRSRLYKTFHENERYHINKGESDKDGDADSGVDETTQGKDPE